MSAATLAAEATIAAFGARCEPSTVDYGEAELSPDGRWVALMCHGNDLEKNSSLRVFSLEGDTEWSVYFADYAKGTEYDRHDMLWPYHWSRDGRYLYAAAESRASGCCWIGWGRLLVRLNLVTGQQTEVVNFVPQIPARLPGVDFSFSPSDRYFLYIPQGGEDQLFVLDLATWSVRVIALAVERGSAGHTLMSNSDKRVILVFREYPEESKGDLTFGSLVVIDLNSGSQRRLISGLDYHKTPLPVRWVDDHQVLLQGADGYWLLDVDTTELTPTVGP